MSFQIYQYMSGTYILWEFPVVVFTNQMEDCGYAV